MLELRLQRVRLTLASVGLLMAACASGGTRDTVATPTQIEPMTPMDGVTVEVSRNRVLNQFDFAKPRDTVWRAMMEVHAAIGIPIATADQDKGTAMFMVQNRYRSILDKPASLFLDCGTGPTGAKADSYRLLIRVHHALASAGAGATVLTTGVESYATNPGVSGDPVPCTSNGRLERDIAALIQTRLRP